MDHKIWYDEKFQTLRMKFVGRIGYDDLIELLKEAKKLLEDKPRRYLINDLSEQDGDLSRKARKMLSEKTKDLGLQRLAFVGTNPVTRMLARIVVAATGQSKNTGFFGSDKEAIVWIQEEHHAT